MKKGEKRRKTEKTGCFRDYDLYYSLTIEQNYVNQTIVNS